MVYQYQKLTGDDTWAQSHRKLFQQFADYLKTSGLNPSLQYDTVDSISATAKQTNLAITSAIGLKAYGALTGNQTYTRAAQSFASTIYTQGLGTNLNSNGKFTKGTPQHFTYNYGMSTSWGTVFNLFPDQYLNLSTFPTAAVSMQCSWYMSQATSVGIPYASVQDDIANGMWDMWIAATCPTDVDTIIGFEHAFFTNGKNTVPFADRFYVTGSQAGTFVTARARPTLGTTFAILLGKGVSFTKAITLHGVHIYDGV